MYTAIAKVRLDHLEKHIEVIKDERKQTLEQYFTKSINERNDFNDFLDNYLQHIEKFVKSANNAQALDLQEVPFIFIGCNVEVEDLDTADIINYHLTDPIQERVGEDDVSYLSPVGKALLLKKVGDEIQVKTPGGTIRYKIRAIHFKA